MPLFPEYAELIKSEIADLKNSGGRYGGAITAAEFLRTFTDDLPWVHLDIAPTARSEGSKSISKGPTGVMVQTLIELTARLA